MNPTLRVTTESGSAYLFANGLSRVRRTHPSRPMRKDNEWVECVWVCMAMGEPMEMGLLGIVADVETYRMTTCVTAIERVDS